MFQCSRVKIYVRFLKKKNNNKISRIVYHGFCACLLISFNTHPVLFDTSLPRDIFCDFYWRLTQRIFGDLVERKTTCRLLRKQCNKGLPFLSRMDLYFTPLVTFYVWRRHVTFDFRVKGSIRILTNERYTYRFTHFY